jgi:hypothetical protein
MRSFQNYSIGGVGIEGKTLSPFLGRSVVTGYIEDIISCDYHKGMTHGE